MTTDEKRIVERVKALLRLAHSQANIGSQYSVERSEHEMQAAAQKAAELIQKHNLSLADLVDDVTKAMSEMAAVLTAARLDVWRMDLSSVVAEHTFTKLYWRKVMATSHRTKRQGIRYSFNFYGRKDNAEVAAYLMDYFMRELEKMGEAFASDYRQTFIDQHGIDPFKCKGLGKWHPNTQRNSYLLGAVHGLLEALRLQRQGVDTQTKAMILVRDAEVEAAWEQRSQGLKNHTNHHSNKVAMSAYHQGVEDGKKLQAKPALTGKEG